MRLFYIVCIFCLGCKLVGPNTNVNMGSNDRILDSVTDENPSFYVKYSSYYLTTDKSYLDSFLVYFVDSTLIEYSGSNSFMTFDSFGDSVEVKTRKNKYTTSKERFWYYSSRISKVQGVLNLNLSSFKDIQSNADSSFSTQWVDGLSKFEIRWSGKDKRIVYNEIIEDPELYIKDSLNFEISLLSGEKKSMLDLKPQTTRSEEDLENCDKVFPLLNITPFLESSTVARSKTVVIYSYLGCAPCMMLKNALVKSAEEGRLNASQIKIVNVMDSDTTIEKYRIAKKVPFEYLKTNLRCRYGTFPQIAAYDENCDLAWLADGFTKLSVLQIRNFLKD